MGGRLGLSAIVSFLKIVEANGIRAFATEKKAHAFGDVGMAEDVFIVETRGEDEIVEFDGD